MSQPDTKELSLLETKYRFLDGLMQPRFNENVSNSTQELKLVDDSYWRFFELSETEADVCSYTLRSED